MTLLTSFSSATRTLVLDASALINLLAIETIVARTIIGTTGAPLVATRRVVDELLVDPRDRSRAVGTRFDALASGPLVGIVSIDGLEPVFVEYCFEVDDGEAATLAYAKHVNGIAVIDDEAARRVAARAEIDVAWTVDLFLEPRLKDTLGETTAAAALFDALRLGRMRIPREKAGAIVASIGVERARLCPSLSPRWYRKGEQ